MSPLTPISPVTLTLTALPTGVATFYGDGIYGADIYGGHAGRTALTLVPAASDTLTLVSA